MCFLKYIIFKEFSKSCTGTYAWKCSHLCSWWSWTKLCSHLNVNRLCFCSHPDVNNTLFTMILNTRCEQIRFCSHLDVNRLWFCTHPDVNNLYFVHICVHVWMWTRPWNRVHIWMWTVSQSALKTIQAQNPYNTEFSWFLKTWKYQLILCCVASKTRQTLINRALQNRFTVRRFHFFISWEIFIFFVKGTENEESTLDMTGALGFRKGPKRRLSASFLLMGSNWLRTSLFSYWVGCSDSSLLLVADCDS